MIERQDTKKLLAESLKDLSKFKSVKKITIKEITQNCGMTPPTFYNHFRDKYELMAWIYNRKVKECMLYLGNGASFEDVVCGWMEIIFEDEEFYLNALKNAVGQNSFRYTTNDYAINLILNWIKDYHKIDDVTKDILFCVKFYMRGVSEIVNEWCLGNREFSPREMAKFFIKAMPENLKPILLQI